MEGKEADYAANSSDRACGFSDEYELRSNVSKGERIFFPNQCEGYLTKVLKFLYSFDEM